MAATMEALRIPTIRFNKSFDELDHAIQISAKSIIVQRPLQMNQVVSFGQSGNSEHYVVGDGWHSSEVHHRWTSRTQSLFAFNALFEDDAILNVDLQMMTERHWSNVQLSIVLNGHKLIIHRDDNTANRISMQTNQLLKPAESFNILIFYSTTASPFDFGESRG